MRRSLGRKSRAADWRDKSSTQKHCWTCGDGLTRANIMKQATNIKGYAADLALPGMTVSTTPDDWRINKQFQMMKFDGQRWVLFGPILTDEINTN